MGLPVFASPSSMAWDSTKTQIWDTKVQKSANGRRKTLSRWSYPQWEIDCQYTCLDPDAVEYTAGFFALVRGQFQPFLWKDPEDYRQTQVRIGRGDGKTTEFQLVRNFEGLFVEPVQDIVLGTVHLFAADLEVGAELGEDGLAIADTAPADGAMVTATFEYYWRVAFGDDALTWENFWYGFYRLNRVKLVTVQ